MANRNEHSENFEAIKMFHTYKVWNIKKVRNAVVSKWITANEYKEITGEDYVAD